LVLLRQTKIPVLAISPSQISQSCESRIFLQTGSEYTKRTFLGLVAMLFFMFPKTAIRVRSPDELNRKNIVPYAFDVPLSGIRSPD